MKVVLINKSENQSPDYATLGSAGMDVRASIDETITLAPLERKLFPTGIYVELAPGYEIHVRPKSGLALKKGLTVLNTPGTIDSDYRGEIGVILINLGNEYIDITPGMEIAQIVLNKVERIEWIAPDGGKLSETDRGEGGFGSTYDIK